jgi:hypothetical protein
MKDLGWTIVYAACVSEIDINVRVSSTEMKGRTVEKKWSVWVCFQDIPVLGNQLWLTLWNLRYI